MVDLHEKRVLIIASPYRGYYLHIAKEIRNKGAFVRLFLSKPKTVGYHHFLGSRFSHNSLLKNFYSKQEINVQARILDDIKNEQFDYILVISIYPLTTYFLTQLFLIQHESKKILYLWDSIKPFVNIESIKLFDKVFSFDFEDSETYSFINYLPLFYIDEYAQLNKNCNTEHRWDVFFLGVNHSIRVEVLNKMADFFDLQGISYNFKLLAGYRSKIRSIFVKNRYSSLAKSLSFDQFKEEYKLSRAIIDISSPYQTGLPIRIIEAIGAGKKIITTNKYITREIFYNRSNVFIWGVDDLNGIKDFLLAPLENMDVTVYSIYFFVEKLFINEISNIYIE
jgi:hypothetical protein